jgi:hypothetical protein
MAYKPLIIPAVQNETAEVGYEVAENKIVHLMAGNIL